MNVTNDTESCLAQNMVAEQIIGIDKQMEYIFAWLLNSFAVTHGDI